MLKFYFCACGDTCAHNYTGIIMAKRVTQVVIWKKDWLACGGTCVHIHDESNLGSMCAASKILSIFTLGVASQSSQARRSNCGLLHYCLEPFNYSEPWACIIKQERASNVSVGTGTGRSPWPMVLALFVEFNLSLRPRGAKVFNFIIQKSLETT